MNTNTNADVDYDVDALLAKMSKELSDIIKKNKKGEDINWNMFDYKKIKGLRKILL